MKPAAFLAISVLFPPLIAVKDSYADANPSAFERPAFAEYQPLESQEILIPAYYTGLDDNHPICQKDRSHKLCLALSAEENVYRPDSERAWKAGIHYDFSEIITPGLTLDYYFPKAVDNEWMSKKKNEENQNKYKHSIKLRYAFQTQALKGLSLKFEYSQHYSNQNTDSQKNNDKIMPYKDNNKSDMGLYINYTINVF
ncbi:OprD family porin [Endozoicomonas sp. Mp262]|uniref:OprD family porin n=1 Tax=Endozoicomonas sp. Mp262 TaxID=2919499 RepID=UPI0021DB4516